MYDCKRLMPDDEAVENYAYLWRQMESNRCLYCNSRFVVVDEYRYDKSFVYINRACPKCDIEMYAVLYRPLW